MKKLIVILLMAGVVSSCKKDIPPKRASSTGSISTVKKLLICNEGNFGSGNSTISLYDPSGGSIVYDAYAPANSNQYIGDVVQSGKLFAEKYFWVVNNSGKVVVTDKNFIKLSSITGFISPRYMEIVSNNKAYVSNLQLNSAAANYIQVFDLNSNTISKNIRLDGWTEEMVQSYGKVYVCNQRRNYVYVINSSTDAVVDSIYVNATSACIVKDKNEKLWVSCNADAANNVPARLLRIDPVADTVEADISLQTTSNSVSRLKINSAGNILYYMMNDIFKFPITATTPSSAFIAQGNRAFYGLCVDPADETIYVSDAIDFNQDGNVLRYKSDGTYVNTFKAGVSPGFMWIEE
ncbi:MAG: YncE family protein [Bacteroidia bacterium]